MTEFLDKLNGKMHKYVTLVRRQVKIIVFCVFVFSVF